MRINIKKTLKKIAYVLFTLWSNNRNITLINFLLFCYHRKNPRLAAVSRHRQPQEMICVTYRRILEHSPSQLLKAVKSRNHASWSWSSQLDLWIRISFKRGVLDIILCDKVCQWLATGRWFSPALRFSPLIKPTATK